jgi:hypothetical protein
MSDFTPAPTADENVQNDRSLGQEIARETAVNFAAAAATAIGFVGSLVVINRVADRLKARKAAQTTDTEIQEPETQGS